MNRRHSLPAEVYALVEQTPATVLLEGQGRTSDSVTWLFADPVRVLEIHEPGQIPHLFDEIERSVSAGLYAAGFFTYECGQCFEPTAAMRPPAEGQLLAWLAVYARSYIFDPDTGSFLDGDPPGLKRLRNEPSATVQSDGAAVEADFLLNEDEYAARIAAIHEWIRAGDIYQLNFTAPFRVRTHESAARLYARLRARQPVEYGAFIHWQPGSRILSFSPEFFFRVEHRDGLRTIEAQPMKGTAPRGRTTREDRQTAEWLRNDLKNRSENVMIVDLVRNDLGRLCEFGSVRADDLFSVERFPSLWQMTSTVRGTLRSEIGYRDIFRALFPCGSITGAPKVHAMQLAARIEDAPRGVYTGAIGFFSPRQTMFNVAIRTLQLDGDFGTMGVGSGIVIDSSARDEYRECLLKARFLTASADEWPDEFSMIESLLWQEGTGYPLIELHLDRLVDSADYFGFTCEREVVEAALLEHARGFGDGRARKVRLLMDRDGELRIASEALSDAGGEQRKARVRIAATRTDPQDRMLFHKTTHRQDYDEAFKAAISAGYDEVLFLNVRGEVTEGAISNIFVVKDARWLTPPVECGLLAGVYRRHLLETRADAEERVLYPKDLRTADAVYICNAVRGLRRASVAWDDGLIEQ
jgi:para-aminobenzoate synthetase/4-amino-4-deoxychorismate lyase